jgi:hypothetical protein
MSQATITPIFQNASSILDIACGLNSNLIIQSFYRCFGKNNTNPQICSGNGICKGLNQCSCEEGYLGNECQFTTCFGIIRNQTNVCSGNGNCTDYNKCSCVDGYGGKNCQEFYQNESIVFGAGYNTVI